MVAPLPSTRNQRRIAIRTTRDAQRQIRSGHPWLFDGSIVSQSHDGDPGDLAVVFDDKRRFLAIGLFDPTSPIRVRILHAGKPTTIDGEWLGRRLADSVERRRPLSAPVNTGLRLVHGENDGLPGLVVDWYQATAVVKLYTSAWGPWLADVVDGLRQAPGRPVERIVLRTGRSVDLRSGPNDGAMLSGPAPTGPIDFSENGLTCTADPVHGHKTGYFLDQRDNRRLLASLVAGADPERHRVLDVFSCTGGFAAHAAAVGASRLTMVDISQPALDLAKIHVRGAVGSTVREPDGTPIAPASDRMPEVEAMAGDAFDVMGELGRSSRRFDTVVVDPPSFAHRRNQLDRALAAYRRSAAAAAALVDGEGVLFHASCSSRVDETAFIDQVMTGVRDAGRRAEVIHTTGHALDHPIGFVHGAYLKAVALRLD